MPIDPAEHDFEESGVAIVRPIRRYGTFGNFSNRAFWPVMTVVAATSVTGWRS